MEIKESNRTEAKQSVLKLRATACSWPENLSHHWQPAVGIGGEGPGTWEVGGPHGGEEKGTRLDQEALRKRMRKQSMR